MRALPFLLAGLALATTSASAVAQDQPDFSGKWKYDAEQSEGPVTAPPQLRQMAATRNSRRPGDASAGRLGGTPGIAPVVPGQGRQGVEQTISIKVDKGVLQLDQTTNGIKEGFKFKLDGSESENDFFPPRSQTAAKLKTTSRWEGAQLITEGSGSANTDNGVVLVTFSEKRYLSEDGSIGVVLGEIYLVGDPAPGGSSLVNLSNRGQVGLGAEAMIGGFVVDGDGPVNLLIRGIGPSLTQFNVTGVVADPVIKIRDRDGQLIGSNDNWEDAGLGSVLATVGDSVGAFALAAGSADAAILLVLDPGNYTVVLSGADGGTGTGLVEIYLVP